MAELKPCPFCGGFSGVAKIQGLYYISCFNRECIAGGRKGVGSGYITKKIAIEEWNRRAGE